MNIQTSNENGFEENHKFDDGNEQRSPGAIALCYSRIYWLYGVFAFPHIYLA